MFHVELKASHLNNYIISGRVSVPGVGRGFRLNECNPPVALCRTAGYAKAAKVSSAPWILLYDRELRSIEDIHASLSYQISLF